MNLWSDILLLSVPRSLDYYFFSGEIGRQVLGLGDQLAKRTSTYLDRPFMVCWHNLLFFFSQRSLGDG